MTAKLNPIVEAVTQQLVDKGKIIEAGWVGLKMMAVPADAPQIQIDEMRNAFFAGAQHLFASMMSVLDPGEEPTDRDLRRMALIEAELQTFAQQFAKKHLPTKGSA